MKCKICGKPAVIKLRAHNIALCPEHFTEFFERQVRRTISKYKMLTPGERVLVAVSGGKDSLVLITVLQRLGYDVMGFHIDLGIGEYSQVSRQKAEAHCEKIGAPCLVYDLKEMFGMGITEAARKSKRSPCSLCGMTKRYLMNMAARETGIDVVATGHNLDDQAAALFANLLRWDVSYLAKGSPVLPAEHGFPRKVKPLALVSEREVAAYALINGIDYVRWECPHSEGARFLVYKEHLNQIEEMSPGTKRRFYQGYLDNIWRFQDEEEERKLKPCKICGMPTAAEDGICSFCKFWRRDEVEKLKGKSGS